MAVRQIHGKGGRKPLTTEDLYQVALSSHAASVSLVSC